MNRQLLADALEYAIVRRKGDAKRFARDGHKSNATYAEEQVAKWIEARMELARDWAAGVVTKVGDTD